MQAALYEIYMHLYIKFVVLKIIKGPNFTKFNSLSSVRK